MNKIDEAVNFIRIIFPKNIYTGINIDPSILDIIENHFDIILSRSYRYYIESFGFVRFFSFMPLGIISSENFFDTGLGWILKISRSDEIPKNIVTIDEIGDGSYYALDLSQMNDEQECPVVIWPVGGYDETPELEIVAPDFGTWFYDQVMKQIEMHKKQND